MMLSIRPWLLLVLALPAAALAQAWLAPTVAQPEFLEAGDVFRIEATAGEDGATRLVGRIAPGYYLYRHRLDVVADGGQSLPLELPEGKAKTDEFFGRTEVYYDAVEIRVDGAGADSATLHWQGCADAGICYPPQTMRVDLPAARPAPGATVRASYVEPAADGVADDQRFAGGLADASVFASIAIFFGMGLLLAFTPCTLPMIPIISSLVVDGQPSARRALALSAAYVLPMALTYAALGVGAGLAGANLQAALQNPWLVGAFAAVFVTLALSLLGAFELQLPAWVGNRLDRAGRGQRGGSLGGAAALGFFSALLVGPCMTAPLAGALLYIGQSGSAVTGGVALFALGLGMGLPLLAIAVFGARILPRPGAWMERVRVVFAFVLLATAISMLARVLSPATVLVLWGAWLLGVATALMAMATPDHGSALRVWLPRYLATAAAVWALALLVGGAGGAVDPWRPLAFASPVSDAQAAGPRTDFVAAKTSADLSGRIAQAGARGQWTLVDFYADWCVACHVIERDVFGDPEVAATLAGMQVVRPDVTRNDAHDQALMKAWQVAGPPTLLLIGPDGREHRAERTVGDVSAEQFLARLRRVMQGES